MVPKYKNELVNPFYYLLDFKQTKIKTEIKQESLFVLKYIFAAALCKSVQYNLHFVMILFIFGSFFGFTRCLKPALKNTLRNWLSLITFWY